MSKAAREHEGTLARVARSCARHHWRTIGAWLAVAVAIVGASQTIGGTLVDEFSIPNSDAQRATDLLKSRFPSQAGDAATVVFAAGEGRLDAGAQRGVVERALRAAREVPDVVGVGDPFAQKAAAITADGAIAYADVQFGKLGFELDKEHIEQLQADVRAAVSGSEVQVEFTGIVIQASEAPQPGASEAIALAAAGLILLLVFGSVVAATLPLVLALVSLGLGISLLLLAAALTTFNTTTPVLATMLGLGVGIDYSLFIVTRFRQALHDGLGAEDAAAAAAATAGRAVIFAGVTVAVSIMSLAVIGLDFITKLGFGAAMTVVAAVAAAVTLLPALLSLLGHRVDRGRVPFVSQDDSHAARHRSLVARWARFVTRHARASTAGALVLLIVLALPAAWVRLGSSDPGSNPPGTTTRRAYDLLATGFGPGINGPLLVAVDQRNDRTAAATLARAFRETPGVLSVPPPRLNERRNAALVVVYPRTSPESEATQQLVTHLRAKVVPETLAGSQAIAYVGGPTAAFEDIAERISSRLPYFFLVAIGITFLMLATAFRSLVIAVKASLATLLSALAAFGVLVAVFQLGWGGELIGIDKTGPVESFLPVIVFAILFGLSMDYEVFLVSRIREEYVHGDTPRDAIIDGMAAIGRVVIAAAAIMTVVFLAFLLEDDRIIKEFGLGLGTAILIDAFIVRMVLVPAVMHLLDERAWWIPRWLDRLLPRVTVEAPTTDPIAERVAPQHGNPQP
jgi:putative drug exporter of the RND superfamily